MISKWEWIKNKLEELNIRVNHADFHDLYAIASEIGKILIEIYDNTITENFKDNFYKIESEYNNQKSTLDRLRYIDAIAICRTYCIACVQSKNQCNNCEFVKKAGRCSDNDSLYGKFSYLLTCISQRGPSILDI